MSNELQQFQQKVWVKEQEINALKVQNRHLIAKLEEAELSAKPNQINTQQIAQQIVSAEDIINMAKATETVKIIDRSERLKQLHFSRPMR